MWSLKKEKSTDIFGKENLLFPCQDKYCSSPLNQKSRQTNQKITKKTRVALLAQMFHQEPCRSDTISSSHRIGKHIFL